MAERYEVVVTSRAEESLKQIVLYLNDNVSYETAERVRMGLLDAIEKLARHPESNGILQEISDHEVTYRRVIKWSYRIIYIIEEGAKIIFVLEIDHVRRNPKHLKEIFR